MMEIKMIDIYPTYYLKFPSDTTWTDISPIVDSKQTSITYNGCNKDIKSAIDTADITLMGVDEVGYVELRSYVIACLLAALEDGSTVLAKILRPDGDFYFYGKVDLSNFSIESSRIPGSIRLACDDNSYLLDENIAQSFEWPSKDFPGVNKDGTFVDGAGLPIFVRTGESIVGNLLSMAGYAVPDIIAPDTALVTDRIIDLPYDVDDKKTYRGLMNTLLFEHGSVFSFDRDGKFRVTKLSFENPVATRSVDNYVDADKIKTSTSIYDNDGIKLTWSTLGLMKQGTLYVDNISNNRDDSGEIIGEEVKSGEYYPSTGDIEDVYQSFDAKFLDRPYLTAQSRLQNKDLSLISARNINYEIMPSGKFTLPTVGTLTTNPMLYPTKARFLFYNPTDKAVNIQRFRIAGDSLYRAKNNIYTVPDFSKNPEEYVSTYIYTEDEATTFSNFYRIFKKYGQLSHKWSEIADVPLFEVVAVPHKKTDVHTIAMVISTTLSFAGDKVKSAVSAIGISRYDALPPKKESVTTGSGLSAQDGRPGIDAKVLSLNLSATQFSFNADGAPKEQDDITVSVSQQGIGHPIHLYVDGTEVEISMGKYSIPAVKLVGCDHIRVRATCGDHEQENIITRVMDGQKGEPGTATSCTVSLSRSQVAFYADNVAKDMSPVIATVAYTGLPEPPLLYVNGIQVPLTDNKYSIPVNILDDMDSAAITVTGGGYDQTVTLSKIKDPGSLVLDVSKSVVPFYADDVPYAQGAVVVSVSAPGFSTPPVLKKDGVTVALTDGKYAMEAGELVGVDNTVFTATVSTLRRQATVSKRMDAGTISLELSRDTFRYYADGPQHEGQDPIIAALSYTGFSKAPTLTVKGVEVNPESGSYSIPQTIMGDEQTVGVEARLADVSATRTIRRAVDSPALFLNLNSYMFHYYADNIAYAQGDITATVEWQGLYHAPRLTVGGTAYALDSSGQAAIPASVVASVDSVEVKAYSERIPALFQLARISRREDVATLHLATTGTQFSYDKDGALKGPDSIVLSYSMSGVSSVVPTLKIGGASRKWTDGKYTLPASELGGRQFIECVAALEPLSLSSTVLIVRTDDGKGAKHLSLSSDAESFRLKADGTPYGGQEIHVKVLKQGIDETVVWDMPGHVVPDGTMSYVLTPADMGDDFAPLTVTITAGAYTDSLIIAPVRDGANAGGEYLGAGLSPPSARMDGSDVQFGDYYLDTSNPQAPVPYIIENDGLWLPVGRDDPRWSYVAPNTQTDVLALGGTLLSTSAYYAWFANISGSQAAIDTIGTKRLVLNENGELVSGNYYPSNGADGLRISANGNVDFNNGTWRGDIATGLMSVRKGSALSDGTDAFFYDHTMTVSDVYNRYVKAGVTTKVYDSYTMESDSLPLLQRLDAKSFNFMGSFQPEDVPQSSGGVSFSVSRSFNLGKGMFIVQGTLTDLDGTYSYLITNKALDAKFMAGMTDYSETFDVKGAVVDITEQLSGRPILYGVYDELKQQYICTLGTKNIDELHPVMSTDINGTSVSFTQIGVLPDTIGASTNMKPTVGKAYEEESNRYRYINPSYDANTNTASIFYSYDMLDWTRVPVDGQDVTFYAVTMKGDYYYAVAIVMDGLGGSAPYFARVHKNGGAIEMLGGPYPEVGTLVAQCFDVYASRVSDYVYFNIFFADMDSPDRYYMDADGVSLRYNVVSGVVSPFIVPSPVIVPMYHSEIGAAPAVFSSAVAVGYDAVHGMDIVTYYSCVPNFDPTSSSDKKYLSCECNVGLIGHDGTITSEVVPFGKYIHFNHQNSAFYMVDSAFVSDSEGVWGTPVWNVLLGWENYRSAKVANLESPSGYSCFPIVHPFGQYIRKVSEEEYRVSVYGYGGSLTYHETNIGHFTIRKHDTSVCPVVADMRISPQLIFLNTKSSPFKVHSDTLVSNLNAELLDGKHAADIVRDASSATSSYASQAASSASAASNSASAAKASETAAASSKSAAANSASAAKVSEDNAAASKTAAAGSASAAKTSETNAASSKTAAASSASAASTSATSAAGSATAAATLVRQAETALNSIPQFTVGGTTYDLL